MELAEVVNTQYAFPVGIVLICAVLVFAFGFKSSNPPTFSQPVHAADERKTAGKKRKLKDKKLVQNNSSSSAVSDDGRKQKLDNSSRVSLGKASRQTRNAKDELEKNQVISNKQQQSKKKNISQKENVNESLIAEGKITAKDVKQTSTAKKIQSNSDSSIDLKIKSQEKRLLKEKNYNIQLVKTNKNAPDSKPKSSKSSKSKLNEVKPSDFDDGEWEQAISRKEKKSKKKDEEALMAANAVNSGTVSSLVNQSPVSSTMPNTDSSDLPAPTKNTGAHVATHSGTSNDTPITDDHPSMGVDINDAVSDNAYSVGILSGENEKKESSTKAANAGASSSATNEKPKSSKSKGKNKESSLSPSLQKDAASLENENVTAVSNQPLAEESTKSKRKKKQTNVAENKEGKSSSTVETLKQSVVMEETTGGGEQGMTHDITSDVKVEPPAAVVFDELGDIWKEAKAPKKSKKKVRKDQ